MLQCPRDGDVLCNIEYEGVEIETCPTCKGEWLDSDELKKIVQTAEQQFTPEEIADLDAVNRSVFHIDDSVPNQVQCPKCEGVELNRFNYASSSGIELDKCPACGGIWLDKDELEKVQILIEESNKQLGQDMKKYGKLLGKVRVEQEAGVDRAVSVSRFGFVNAILRYFL